jgi:hypothetical protein
MSIYEHQFRFEIQNQKVDKIWKTEYQAADRPPRTADRPQYQKLDSPVCSADSLIALGREPSVAPARTVRDRQ